MLTETLVDLLGMYLSVHAFGWLGMKAFSYVVGLLVLLSASLVPCCLRCCLTGWVCIWVSILLVVWV